MRTEGADETREGESDTAEVCEDGLEVPAPVVVVVFVGGGPVVEVADEDVAIG